MKRSILKIIDLKSWLVFGSAYYSKDKKLELAIYHYKNNRDTSTITVIYQLLNYICVCVCVVKRIINIMLMVLKCSYYNHHPEKILLIDSKATSLNNKQLRRFEIWANKIRKVPPNGLHKVHLKKFFSWAMQEQEKNIYMAIEALGPRVAE